MPASTNVIVAASLFGAKSAPHKAANMAPGAATTGFEAASARRTAARWSALFNRPFGAPVRAGCA